MISFIVSLQYQIRILKKYVFLMIFLLIFFYIVTAISLPPFRLVPNPHILSVPHLLLIYFYSEKGWPPVDINQTWHINS